MEDYFDDVSFDLKEEVRFGYAEFDATFEELKHNFDFLQENASHLSAEKVHKTEMLLNDFGKARSIYSKMRESNQKEANALIETLLKETKFYYDELLMEVDEKQMKQIKKLVMKHEIKRTV